MNARLIGLCCSCVIAASPASYGFLTARIPNTAPAVVAVDGGLPDTPVASPQVTVKGLPLAILKDQIPIWTSPVRVRPHDLVWLLPLGAATGITLATDTDAMRYLSRDPTVNKDCVNASNYLLGSQIAAPAILFGVGVAKGNTHAKETGILSGEAMADAAIVETVSKIIVRRERPLFNNAAGDFFAPNVSTNGSFPSSHSMLAWSVAGVMAGEYPSMWARVGVYTTATGVSLMRVLGQEHFPTDVLVGGAAGWLIGHYVFRKYNRTYRPLLLTTAEAKAASNELNVAPISNAREHLVEVQELSEGAR